MIKKKSSVFLAAAVAVGLSQTAAPGNEPGGPVMEEDNTRISAEKAWQIGTAFATAAAISGGGLAWHQRRKKNGLQEDLDSKTTEAGKLAKERDGLKSDKDKLEKEKTAWATAKNKLETELSAANDDRDTVGSQLRSANRNLTTVRGEKEKLEGQLASLKSEKATADKEAGKLRKELATTKDELTRLQGAGVVPADKHAALVDKLEELQGRADKLEAAEARLAAANETLEIRAGLMGEKDKAISEYQQLIERHRLLVAGAREAMGAEAADKLEEFAGAEAAREAMDEKLVKKEAELKTLQEALEELAEAVAPRGGLPSMGDHDPRVIFEDEAPDVLAHRVKGALDAEREAAQRTGESLEHRLGLLQRSFDAKAAELEAATADGRTKAGEIDSLRAELDAAGSRFDDVRSQLAELNRENAELQDARSQLSDRNSELLAVLDREQAENASRQAGLQRDIDALRAQIARLQRQPAPSPAHPAGPSAQGPRTPSPIPNQGSVPGGPFGGQPSQPG